jgi:oxygen-dependent protoporphyrinogen oxidase
VGQVSSSAPYQVAVVGGGIAGLAAAWFLTRDAGDRVAVTVFEASPEPGGKLRVSEIAGVPVDAGAEAILARRPEGVALARAVGLADEVVTPETTRAGVWTRGALRPLPAGQVMGVPADLGALARSGVLSPRGVARAGLDLVLPRTGIEGDVAVGVYVRTRLGREVVDRLVEPLLGGVYAGRADALSLEAAVPQLAEAARRGRSLIAAVRRMRAGAPAPDGAPVFAGIRGGVGRLPAAVAKASGATIRLGSTVRELHRREDGWLLTVGPTRDPETVAADAVILAVPARPAARLLATVAPPAAADLEGIEYASVALVTLAYPAAAFPRALPGSGFLVPAIDERLIKGATFASAKWAWVADAAGGLVVVRLSVGRHGEERDLQRDDDELVALASADLAAAVGVAGPPVDARVTRWGGSLPQYAVGHRDRVRRIRAAVSEVPGLGVCGAAYDGLGIPACVASAEAAATQVLSTGALGGE